MSGSNKQHGVPSDRRIPQAGEVLCGIYRLDRMLGFGAVGIVYAAWHLELRRACALKLLHPNFVEDQDVRERFRREALSAFKLSHPHIIRITDFREHEGGWPLMVMELLSGESLRQRLQRGALALREVRDYFTQLCGAMTLAHQHGVVHRDLKPENIFLARGSGGGEETDVLKVLDFGISKIADHTEITAMHVLLGSPSYMSPEQARGDARMVDARADIFSMGVILFECLTGRKAFVSADPEQKRQLIMQGAVPSLLDFAPDLPAELDGVIRRACAVVPADRFQSAAELLAALRSACDAPAPRRAEPGPGRAALPLPGMMVGPVRGQGPPAQPAAEATMAVEASALEEVADLDGPATLVSQALPLSQTQTVMEMAPLKTTVPLAQPAAKRADRRWWAGALGRLGLRSRTGSLTGDLHDLVKGREAWLVLGAVFLVALIVLVVLDMSGRPEPQLVKPLPPRLKIIDGQQR